MKKQKKRRKPKVRPDLFPQTCKNMAYIHIELMLERLEQDSFQLCLLHEDISDLIVGVCEEIRETFENMEKPQWRA